MEQHKPVRHKAVVLQNGMVLQNGTVIKKVHSHKTVHVTGTKRYMLKKRMIQNGMIQNGTLQNGTVAKRYTHFITGCYITVHKKSQSTGLSNPWIGWPLTYLIINRTSPTHGLIGLALFCSL
jgi:hypothetical protein